MSVSHLELCAAAADLQQHHELHKQSLAHTPNSFNKILTCFEDVGAHKWLKKWRIQSTFLFVFILYSARSHHAKCFWLLIALLSGRSIAVANYLFNFSACKGFYDHIRGLFVVLSSSSVSLLSDPWLYFCSTLHFTERVLKWFCFPSKQQDNWYYIRRLILNSLNQSSPYPLLIRMGQVKSLNLSHTTEKSGKVILWAGQEFG